MSSISPKSCEVNEHKKEQTEFVREVEDFVSDLTSKKGLFFNDAEVLV